MMANQEDGGRQRGVPDDRKLPEESAQAERLLAEQLLGGAAESADAQAEAVRKLPPRWEIRIQTEHDPVAEETRKYRSLAKEIDGRYDGRSSSGGSER